MSTGAVDFQQAGQNWVMYAFSSFHRGKDQWMQHGQRQGFCWVMLMVIVQEKERNLDASGYEVAIGLGHSDITHNWFSAMQVYEWTKKVMRMEHGSPYSDMKKNNRGEVMRMKCSSPHSDMKKKRGKKH